MLEGLFEAWTMRMLRHKGNHLLALLVFCGLASRIFVPQGFMPTSLEDGMGIKFCPAAVGGGGHHDASGLPMAEGGDHAAHLAQSPDPGPADPDPANPDGHGGSICPVGAFFAWGACPENAPAVVAVATFVLAELRPAAVVFASATPHSRPHPRGPPPLLSHSA